MWISAYRVGGRGEMLKAFEVYERSNAVVDRVS